MMESQEYEKREYQWEVEFPNHYQYTVVANTGNGYALDFKVYQVRGWEEDGKKLYNSTDTLKVPIERYTTEVGEAAVLMEGFLKWDGCCNFTFPGCESLWLHTCAKEEAGNLGRVLEFVYDHGPCIPTWNG